VVDHDPNILDDNDHALRTHLYRTAQRFFLDTHRYDAFLTIRGPKLNRSAVGSLEGLVLSINESIAPSVVLSSAGVSG
jgi:hypothetical protein